MKNKKLKMKKKLNLPFYHSKTGLHHFFSFLIFYFSFFIFYFFSFFIFIFYFLFLFFLNFFFIFYFFSKVHVNNILYCGFTSNSPALH